MEDLVKLSKFARLFFEQNKEKVGLPFFYSFPKNSCEGASFLLAWLFMERFPNLDVEVIHGEDEMQSENHYWVEVDGYVYDITVDQFAEVPEPVYGLIRHPMAHHFMRKTRYFASVFMLEYMQNSANEECANQAYRQLNNALSKSV